MGVFPITWMVFLPLPDALSVLLIAEIFLVAGLFQPSLLAGSFAGLLAVGLPTETLTFPMPVIRKKMFLAVEAFASVLLSLHRFPNRKNQGEEKSGKRPKKIRRKENSEPGRRKKNFQRRVRRK